MIKLDDNDQTDNLALTRTLCKATKIFEKAHMKEKEGVRERERKMSTIKRIYGILNDEMH